MYKKYPPIKQLLICFLILMLFTCARNYNPFSDPSNAQLHIESMSFKENDTVQIFQAETLFALTTVRELLDSFSIHIEKNRLWKDTTVRRQSLKEWYIFRFSIYDTGKQSIIVTNYPSGLRPNTRVINFSTRSPLKQAPIIGGSNVPFTLESAPVRDPDVFYTWNFGTTIEKYSIQNVTKCTLTIEPTIDTGWLWVTDQSHKYPSPRVPFQFVLKDINPPVIYCENKPQARDTVRTGDSVFLLRCRIFDKFSNDAVHLATINGHSFDSVNTPARLYMYTIPDMYTYTKTSPLTATIFARDNEVFQNDTSHTFFIYYDSTLQNMNDTRIIIYNITQDSLIQFTDTLFPVIGRIENTGNQKRILKAYVNDTLNIGIVTFPNGNGEWRWLLNLRPYSINTVRIEAQDSQGITKAAETLSVYHTDVLSDKEKPVIVQIKVNAESCLFPDTFFTEQYNARTTVTAYDKNSLVSTVFICGKNAAPANNLLEWTVDTLGLIHVKNGNSIPIEVKDKAGNTAKKSITVFQNTPPALRVLKPFPKQVFVDTCYTASYLLEDDDANDPVTITIVNPLDSLTLNQADNTIRWKPQKPDTGNKIIFIRISDGYANGIVTNSWDVTVLEKPLPPVEFLTTTDDLPDSIIYKKDTLKAILHIRPRTGNPPFLFTILNTSSGEFIVHNAPDSSFLWIPKLTDIGMNTLLFSVVDSFATMDTFYHTVKVSSKNQYPCSLSVAKQGVALKNLDTVKLQNLQDTAVLTCTIHDKDQPLPEVYRVSYTTGTTTVSYPTQDTLFSIRINPVANNKVETLVITVTDETGPPAQYTLFIKYPAVVFVPSGHDRKTISPVTKSN